MAITIYDSDYDALWQQANPSSQNLESAGFSETLQLVPDRLGQGYVRSIQLYGINLLLFNYQLHDDVFVISKGQDTSDISREFGFNLSGDRSGKRTGENFVEWGNFDDPDEHILIAYAKEPILKVDIHLESGEMLGQTISEILEELPAETRQRISDNSNLSDIDRITPTMQSALRQILYCPFQGKTKQIYLESKCLELITLKLEQLKQRDKKTGKLSSLKSDDIDRIRLAKTILSVNFDNPPSLIELARQVGLNDCTLKRGFREVLGTTAFGYLHNYRLEQARQLLQERRLNISEIARTVGFANYTSLSKGFRKKYGVSPKQYQTRSKNSV
ncbi:Transcriptional family [Hyella patelloides LEGE 07179]|uniref:Transcriptional family n=1 Tax=Hyella patelloides LEGE 07179 TaxID=945734 RepID=A0A563VNQ3_9CYAN|nr:AraC family transcriptional regulator [Hyella patelloides]VEP12997.1 Transcriptional family [Hyella patelloides LEGE 07179]